FRTHLTAIALDDLREVGELDWRSRATRLGVESGDLLSLHRSLILETRSRSLYSMSCTVARAGCSMVSEIGCSGVFTVTGAEMAGVWTCTAPCSMVTGGVVTLTGTETWGIGCSRVRKAISAVPNSD